MKCQFRIPMLMLLDAFLFNLALVISYFTYYQGHVVRAQVIEYLGVAIFVTLPLLTVFFGSNLYSRVWAYASVGELLTIIQAVSITCLTIWIFAHILKLPLTSELLLPFWSFTIVFVGGSRFGWRIFVEFRKKTEKPNFLKPKKTLIYGAGSAGALVAREFRNHYNGNMPVVGFIDDDPHKHHLTLYGLPVLGGRENIPSIVHKFGVDEIIIAMPSVSGKAIKEIIEVCKQSIPKTKILPGVYQLLDGRVSISAIRPVNIEDLLGREPIQVNLKEISEYLKNKVVVVTGAGGSIGSELCRQIAQLEPKKIVLLGHGENSIHRIWLELLDKFPTISVEIEIADIRDRFKLDLVFSKHRPQVVFHAAAHKHVPLMELHPDEAIKTNVFGTKYVAEAAERYKCETFILISTDKAVNPSSVMGATKRLAELIIQNLFKDSSVKFAAVRFGNVLGSSGSVIPIFKEQIARGGPVTVTHPEMTRYFMTIPEAVQLVIQAGAMAKGREIYLLDMGEPVRILDLAANLIKLSGLEPGTDIEIKFTGIRPGEKLFEELLTDEEDSSSTKHKRIFIAKPVDIDNVTLMNELLKLAKREVSEKNEVFERLQIIMSKPAYYNQEMVI